MYICAMVEMAVFDEPDRQPTKQQQQYCSRLRNGSVRALADVEFGNARRVQVVGRTLLCVFRVVRPESLVVVVI